MKYSYSAAALFAATVSADLCHLGSSEVNGNWYCQAVKGMTYTGVGKSGSYNKITNMDSTTGTCSSTPYAYSGAMAPLDEELSLHFRGPMNIAQIAVYFPDCGSNGKKRSAHAKRHAHGHGHAHGRMHSHSERDADPGLGDVVSAMIDGKLQSWTNTYSGQANNAPAAPAPAPAVPAPAPVPAANGPSQGSSGSAPPPARPAAKAPAAKAPAAKAPASSPSDSGSCSGSDWGREAYYDADSGTADGLVFLNYQGGKGSGTFDYVFGNSLSYASSDGCEGASSPQVLEACTLKSNNEVIVMSDKECSGNDCGYFRPGTVAHHGFGGASKIFLVELGMPDDGKTGASQYDPVNMPAFWTLNAQIPRTLQYGKPECSCWESGCGEFDVFEVLAPGDTRCKSTLHGNTAGGNSDYFLRPTSGTAKGALIFYNDNIHIKMLDQDFDFSSSISDDVVQEWINDTSSQSADKLVSLFKLNS
jgi:hypothetical protein